MTAVLAILGAALALAWPFGDPLRFLPAAADEGGPRTMLASDIHMRDPFILPCDGQYYLVGTTGDAWGAQGGGFEVYTSADLVHWTPRGQVMAPDNDRSWAAYQFWAPEMYARDGRFYLFYSGKTDTTRRGTGVAVSDSPLGPFRNVSQRPLTPPDWECLDGHLFRDADGTEWFIFVHEWVQCEVGEMWIQRIAEDYSSLVGDRRMLFRGRSAPWNNHVIDGPMMVVRDGTYHLFWSSFNDRDGYCTGVAAADDLLGPYTQSEAAVIGQDGGHNCVFRGFDGKLYTSFHRPNATPEERVRIAELVFDGGKWRLGAPR